MAITNYNLQTNEDTKIDFLFSVMDNEVSVCDRNGIIIRIGETYLNQYNAQMHEILGQSVYELEKKGIFTPSISAIVLESKKKTTISQQNKHGEMILVTGVPIFNDIGHLEYVISFNSVDIAHLGSLRDKYEKLSQLLTYYKTELLNKDFVVHNFISKSQSMQHIHQTIVSISDVDVNVLISGQTGVGKSLIAKLIHEKSDRNTGPFIEINSAAIPDSLLESELFGYTGGSFTGASKAGKTGKIQLAHGGTLFLDEIGELPLHMQKKLLQVIQEKKIIKIGDHNYINVDFRLIVATNKDLKSLVEKGEFREDLFYRLNVLPIQLPALKERKEDIIPLALHFLEIFNQKYHRNKKINSFTFEKLVHYEWPGNIRELENLIERLVVTTQNEFIEVFDLLQFNSGRSEINENTSLKDMLETYEKEIIEDAYFKYKTTVKMASVLNIGQSSVVRKLQKYIKEY